MSNSTTGFSLKLAQPITISNFKTDLNFTSLLQGGFNSGMYDTSTGIATVPSSDRFLVGGTITFVWNGFSNSADANIKINLLVNGTLIPLFYDTILKTVGQNDETSFTFLRPFSFNQGDKIKLQFQIGYIEEYLQKIISNGTFFYMYKLN